MPEISLTPSPAVVEVMRRDVHPAEVLMPDGTMLAGLRVFVTNRRLLAFRATAGGLIEQVLDLVLEQPCTVPGNRGTLGAGRLEARLQDGSTAWVNRGHGCGCGSPLKALAAPASWTGR